MAGLIEGGKVVYGNQIGDDPSLVAVRKQEYAQRVAEAQAGKSAQSALPASVPTDVPPQENYFTGKPGGIVDTIVSAVSPRKLFARDGYDEDGFKLDKTGDIANVSTPAAQTGAATPTYGATRLLKDHGMTTPAAAGFAPVSAPPADLPQQNIFSGTAPVVALDGKNIGDTTAISNRVDWTPGGVNAGAYTAANGVDRYGRNYDEQVARAAQVNAATQRDMLMSPREQAAAEVVDNANFGAFTRGGAKGTLAAYEARRNAIGEKLKTDAVLEGERIKGEFGMKAKAGDMEIRRLDREAGRESALEVAALKAKENRETALGVTKLKMDESRTEKELAAEKELRKGKMELAVPDATTAGTDIETAIAAREMGLEARPKVINRFSPNEPAGFYDKKTGKLVDAATIKGMRGKTTGSSAADVAASLRSQGKTSEQIKAELIAQGFKPGTR